jgi:[ribosomal protein S5]-alanine N-acetyltransferase
MLKSILTARLELIPADLKLTELAINNSAGLGSALNAMIPEGWPMKEYTEVLPLFYEHFKQFPEADGWGPWFWILVDGISGKRILIGDGGFKFPGPEDDWIETGYGILPQYWNKGYATEALRALLEWVKETGRFAKVFAQVLPDNIGSIKVLEKNGFVWDGFGEDGHRKYVKFI